MEFNPEEFIEQITWEKFDELRKPELMKLAKHFGLEAKHAMRKQVIKNNLIKTLVQEDVWDDSYLERIQAVQEQGESDAFKLKELEIQKELEIELKKMEMEQKQKEMEMQRDEKQKSETCEVEFNSTRIQSGYKTY